MRQDLEKRLRAVVLTSGIIYEDIDTITEAAEALAALSADTERLERTVDAARIAHHLISASNQRMHDALTAWRGWYERDGSVGGASEPYEETVRILVGEPRKVAP